MTEGETCHVNCSLCVTIGHCASGFAPCPGVEVGDWQNCLECGGRRLTAFLTDGVCPLCLMAKMIIIDNPLFNVETTPPALEFPRETAAYEYDDVILAYQRFRGPEPYKDPNYVPPKLNWQARIRVRRNALKRKHIQPVAQKLHDWLGEHFDTRCDE